MSSDVVGEHGDGDVLLGCERRDQVEVLEDETDLLGADLGQLLVAQSAQVTAREPDRAPSRAVERPEQLQEGRLAGPARAFERDHLAGVDDEVHATDGLDGTGLLW